MPAFPPTFSRWRRPVSLFLAGLMTCTPPMALHAQESPSPIERSSDAAQRNLKSAVVNGQGWSAHAASAPQEGPLYVLPDMGDPSSKTLSAQAERKLGEQAMRQVRRDPDYVLDWLLTDYLNDLGLRLLQAARSQALSGSQAGIGSGFEMFAVRDRSINAFALPGGYIGTHTGLITVAESESELASVLGHEMGHVLQRHIARMLSDQGTSNLLALGSMLLAVLAGMHSANAGQALAMGGQALAVDNQLRFSRDAEREADRVGFQILQAGGFDVRAMAAFFQRLQRANGLNDNGAPAYVRTHPLTLERIADMQNRARFQQEVEAPSSAEFAFMKARARLLQQDDPSGLIEVRTFFENQLRQQSTPIAAAWYGLAITALRSGDLPTAERALQSLRKVMAMQAQGEKSVPSVSVALLAVDLARAQEHQAEALQMAQAAVHQFPRSRASGVAYAGLLLEAGKSEEAVNWLRQKIQQDREQPVWWELLAKAYSRQNKESAEHRALAEKYALEGAWQAAMEQLRIARQAGDGDFYMLSEIDARMRECERAFREERAEQQ